MARQVILRQLERPVGSDEEEHCWFFNSLGVESGRDTEHVAMRIVLSLLQNLPEHRGIPVEKIASDLAIANPRVNHHIRNLVETGLVYREKQRIYIRGSSLRSMIREIRKDTLRILDDLEQAADELDTSFGIENR